MAGHQMHKHSEDMYGTSTTSDRIATRDIDSVDDRITCESILDCLLNTPHPLPADAIAARTDTASNSVETHLDALTAAGLVTATTDESYSATWDDLPLADTEGPDEPAEVFRLEARDKEYREWFGVDDPYDATEPPDADTELAISALGQWFGVRKRLHQLADTQ